jgi:hypothetical protein
LEKIKHGFKTLAECGGIRGVDDTSSFFIYFCTVFCDAWLFCDVLAFIPLIGFLEVTQNHPNISTSKKACYIKD